MFCVFIVSRIGKQPIKIEDSVNVNIKDGHVEIAGLKGQLVYDVPPQLDMKLENGQLILSLKAETPEGKALWGLWRSLLANGVQGVTEGYQKQLEIVGIGLRGQKKENLLELQVGFSHPVEYKPLEGVEVDINKNIITISGIDKQKVGEVAAQIRRIKPPDAYKGKGIRYAGEELKLKPGKAARAVGGGIGK